MAQFKYLAVAQDGTKLKATTEAMSAEALRNELLARQLEVKRISEKRSFNKIEITKQKVKRQEIMHFSRQISAFVRAGIPIVDAIQTVREGTDNDRFRDVLQDVAEQIQSGVPFSEALARHADVFPNYYIGILRSAEITGQLDIVLDQLSTYLERDLESRAKLKSALTYPAIVLVMSVVTVLILVGFVLPRFTGFFKEFHAKLPLPTQLLLDFSDFTQQWWWAILGGFALVFGSVYLFLRTERGQLTKDRLFLRLPLAGSVVQYAVIERFCRIISAMMKAGVPLPEAMQAAIEGANNKVFELALIKAREAMLEGEGLAAPITQTGLFPHAAVQMIRVGEDTGTLDAQLDSSANYYARELDYKLKKVTSLAEPAIIIFMGVVVGFVAVALVSAMYGVFSAQKTQS
ncbi:MAG TPA: type II secretion system F family protein [Acidimicrobiia bacterium]|jgi:type IV pilus assembly protein PilC